MVKNGDSAQKQPKSDILLGKRYANGTGVVKSKGEAAKWIRKAAEQGFDVAQFDLA